MMEAKVGVDGGGLGAVEPHCLSKPLLTEARSSRQKIWLELSRACLGVFGVFVLLN